MNLAGWEKRLQTMKAKHRKGMWRTLTLLLIMVAVIVIIRVILDPLATHYTRKALDDMEGFHGDFQSVHVTIFPPGYEIKRINLFEDDGSAKEPLLFAERVHVGVDWRQLLHADIVGRVRIEHPKIAIIEPAKKAKEETKKKAKRAPDLSGQLQKVTALKVDRIQVFDGEVLFRDLSQPRHPKIWVHELELAAENLATRPELAKGRPTTVAAHGVLGRSGELSAFVSADPFAQPLEFAGRVSLVGFRAAELYDLVEPKTKMQIPEGTIDVFAEFTCKSGAITGGIKPVLKNLKVRPTESGLWDRLKAWGADKALDLFSDRVPDRNAVTAVIPIKGKLTDPDIQLWPSVLGVIRNAFVEGLTSGFAHVPPDTAEKKEGVLKQAKDALKKDEGPPQAQPTGKK